MSDPSGNELLPQHIAIIMDGNGRWARQRGLPRTAGHKVGAKAVKRTVKAAAKKGVKYLTLFGFSSENWKRPKNEVNELMRLLRIYLKSEMAELHKNNIHFNVIGDRTALDPDIISLIESGEKLMSKNRGLSLTIALNYGGRHDIVQAAAAMARDMKNKKMPMDEQTAAELFPAYLMTNFMPDPDLVIRTSGEQRISNFLLWQSAYSEFVFSGCHWPDFDEDALQTAIDEYQQRDRRFGAMKAL